MSAEEFERYSKLISPLRLKMSIPQKIEMYGLWCVASRGKCASKPPYRTNLIEYGKWSAWKKYEHLGQKRAREMFVAKAKSLMTRYPSRL